MKRHRPHRGPAGRFDTGAFGRMVGVLDAVRSQFPNLPVLSILWIHAKHPVHPVQIALMQGSDHETARRPTDTSRSPIQAVLGRIGRSRSVGVRLVVALLNACRLSILIAYTRWLHRGNLRTLRKRRFTLIAKSWGYGSRPRDPARDFYYGDLQSRLARRGLRLLILYGDSTEGDSAAFGRHHASTVEALSCLPEFCLIPLWAPLWMFVLQVASAFSLRMQASQESDEFHASVVARAARDCLLPAVTRTGLYYWLGKETVRTWKPRAWLTLYEGQPWEKALWWGAKSSGSACRTIGYQHAAVFPEAAALLAPSIDIPQRSVPDVVLALGERSAELLRPGHDRVGIPVVSFGSFRYQHIDVDRPADAERRTVLVLPEGLAEEIACLFEFAYDAARVLRDYRFILRCHPNWPVEGAFKLLTVRPEDQPNVVVSKDTPIEADYVRASAMLYRGTSASLYGVLYGLLPVYLESWDLPKSDPLYAMPSWRRSCSTSEGFAAALESDRSQHSGDRTAEWTEAVTYVREYARPVTDDRIDILVDQFDEVG